MCATLEDSTNRLGHLRKTVLVPEAFHKIHYPNASGVMRLLLRVIGISPRCQRRPSREPEQGTLVTTHRTRKIDGITRITRNCGSKTSLKLLDWWLITERARSCLVPKSAAISVQAPLELSEATTSLRPRFPNIQDGGRVGIMTSTNTAGTARAAPQDATQ